MVGSVVEKLNETTYDTLTAEFDAPLFFPQNPGDFKNIVAAKSISLVFKDYGSKTGGYKYGDTLKPISVDIWGRYGGKDTIIGTFNYSFKGDSEYRKSDTITVPLSKDLLDYLVSSISKTLDAIPLNEDGYYPDSTNLDVKKHFFANYFQGIKFRVRNPTNAFVVRIFNPYLLIEYSNAGLYTQEFLLQRNDLEQVDKTAIQSGMFVYPGAIFKHTAYLHNTDGILIQGGASYRTIIDMSTIASWKDSTAMLVNKATLRFELDSIDTSSPNPYLRMTMYNKADSTSISTYDIAYNASLKSYYFEINQMLNTYVSNGIGLENYEFELSCPAPNTTVNKTILKYKDGVSLNVVYSKY